MNRYKLFYHCIYISIICLFLFCPGKAKSQISEGGKPVSFNYQNPLKLATGCSDTGKFQCGRQDSSR